MDKLYRKKMRNCKITINNIALPAKEYYVKINRNASTCYLKFSSKEKGIFKTGLIMISFQIELLGAGSVSFEYFNFQ